MQDEEFTPVIFRKDRGPTIGCEAGEEITAVFPTLPGTVGDPGSMTCYAHIGQHSACSWARRACRRSSGWYHKTRAATPKEYADLKAELERIGYRLKVYKRITPQMRSEFRKNYAEHASVPAKA